LTCLLIHKNIELYTYFPNNEFIYLCTYLHGIYKQMNYNPSSKIIKTKKNVTINVYTLNMLRLAILILLYKEFPLFNYKQKCCEKIY